ncbi:MAG: hypothetical protein M0P18_10020, partial [Syntrophales bacterium]|nr:hypothetical protein [Syntrophales bacterium]
GIAVEAIERSQINAVSAAASLGVGIGGVGVAVSGAGAQASNVILTKTNAYSANSVITSAGDVDITAKSLPAADPLADLDLVNTAAADAFAAKLDDAGATDADNEDTTGIDERDEDILSDRAFMAGELSNKLKSLGIDTSGDLAVTIRTEGSEWSVTDRVTGKSYTLTRDGTLFRVSAPTIGATVIALSAALSGGAVGVGVSIGLSFATNLVGWDLVSDTPYQYTTASEPASVTAGDRVKIEEGVREGSVYEYVGSDPVFPENGDRTVDLKTQDYGNTDLWKQVNLVQSPVEVRAYTADSSIDATGNLTMTATSDQSIDALVVAGSAAASGGSVGVGVSGAGAGAVNRITTHVKAFIEGDGSAGIVADSVTLLAEDTSRISAVTGAASLAAGLGGVGVAVSIGIAGAYNEISNDVAASIYNADNGVKATRGAVTIEAVEAAAINAITAAASLAVSAGFVGVSVSGAGAGATNVILTKTNASIDNSIVQSFGDLVVSAGNTATITAAVLTASAAVSGGEVAVGASIGISAARNFIGYDLWGSHVPSQVQACITGSTIRAGGDIALTAVSHNRITATVFAGSVAVSAGAVGVAGSGAGATVTNRVSSDVKACIKNSTVTGFTGPGSRAGDVALTASDASAITAVAGAASLAGSVGLIGASVSIGVALASNTIVNDVQAFVSGSTVVSRSLDVEALEYATIDALSTAASGALSAGIFSLAISGGGAEASNVIANTTESYITGGTVNVTGNLAITARDDSASTADVLSASVAAGLISVSMGGSAARASLTSRVRAYLDVPTVHAGNIRVLATAVPGAGTFAAGVNAGTLSVGASVATATVSPEVTAYAGGAITAKSLTVSARHLVPSGGTTARAETTGSSGGLIGIDATVSRAAGSGRVEGYVRDGATLDITGAVAIGAVYNSKQESVADSNTAGLVAAGVSTATATSDTSTTAYLGSGVKLTGGSLSITATGNDNNFADTTAGSVGGISVAAASATTRNTSTTTAEIRDGVAGRTIDLGTRGSGAFTITADHTAAFNSRVKALAGGLFGGTGAEIDNSVNSSVNARVGTAVNVTAKDIVMDAANRVRKPSLSGSNIDGTAGGVIAGGGADSKTALDLATLVTIGNNAVLKVVGSPSNPGDFKLRAFNDIDAHDKINFFAAGALSGLVADSTITTLQDLSRVQVGSGANLQTIGELEMSSRGTAHVSTTVYAEAYGAGTYIAAATTTNITPTNQIIISPDAAIRADGDLNLYAGTGADLVRDAYKLSARTDTFAGSAIPIEDLDARANMLQDNTITIGTGALLETAREARLHAESRGYSDMFAKAKAVNWVSETFGSGNSEAMYAGEVDTAAHALVRVDGTVRTGIKRHQSLVLNGIDAAGNISDYTKTEGVTFSTGLESLQSSLQKQLDKAREELLRYQDVNPTLAAFYQSEIIRIQAELEAEGLLETNPDGSTSPVAQMVVTVNVNPIWAEAGRIDVRTDQLTGRGTFDAPGDAGVTILNHTPAFLKIEGITIPESNGGLYLNGVVARSNADVNELNAPDEGQGAVTASFAFISDSSTAAPPEISVVNDFDPRLVGTPNPIPWPDITVIGPIDNLNGNLLLQTHPQGKGDIVINAQVRARNVSVVAGGSVYITGVTSYEVEGSPYSIWKGITVGENGEGTGPASDDAINAMLASIPTDVSLYGDRVYIEAEYLNLNGILQSGRQDYVLTLGQDVIDEIDAIKNSSRSGLIWLTSTADTDFLVRYDTQQDRILIDELRVSGGYVDLTGHILNTGNGEIRVLGGYGQIYIENKTPYDVVLERLDASARGAGVLIIKDKAKGTSDNPAATIYQMTETGVTCTIDDGSGPQVTTGLGTNLTYAPADGWRAGWSVGLITKTETSVTYGTSAWLGIDALAADDANIYDKHTYSVDTPTLMDAGVYYYRTNVGDTDHHDNYTYGHQEDNLEKSDPTLYNTRVESSWYGKKTYYSTYVTGWRDQHTYTHTIRADRDIAITFIGYDQGKVHVKSTQAGADVLLVGAILNSSGTTTIETLGAIEQISAKAYVSGLRVELIARTGIGTVDPFRTSVTDAPAAGLSAVTTSGRIQIEEMIGDLAVDEIASLSGHDVTVWAQKSILVGKDGNGTTAQGLIKGGLLTLTAENGSIGLSGSLITLDSGSRFEHHLSAYAQGDIYLEEINGDLYLNTIESATGDVYIKSAGGIFDANQDAERDERTYEELKGGVWADLRLTEGTGVLSKIQDAKDSLAALKEQEYRQYWIYRSRQADPSVYDPDFEVILSAEEDAFYRNELGWDAAAIQALEEKRTAEYRTLHDEYGSCGDAYDPDFSYTLTAAEASAIEGSIKVWTEEELLYSMSAGLLNPVSDTQVDIEDPNVVGRNVTLIAGGGVGTSAGRDIIDISSRPVTLTTDQRVALAAAERDDIVFLAGFPVTITVNFDETGTITRSGGSWIDDGFAVGLHVQVEGSSRNATEDGQFYEIVGVTDTVLTLASSVQLVSESGRLMTLAPVVLDPRGASVDIVAVQLSMREDVDVHATGTINVTAVGVVYIGSELDLNIGTVTAGDNVRIKSRQGIYSVAAPGASNVVGGDLVLEAGRKSIGTAAVPIVTNLGPASILTARAGTDVYIVEKAGDMNVGTIYAKTGGVYLKTLSGSIVDGFYHELKNIQANSVTLTAIGGGIGTFNDSGIMTDALDVDVVGSGTITATADGSIGITETDGDMRIRNVISYGGNVDLRAHQSILDAVDLLDPYDPDSGNDPNPVAGLPRADVIGNSITLVAGMSGAPGGIGVSGNDLDIDSSYSAPGTLTASSRGAHIYIIETAGDLWINQVSTDRIDPEADYPTAFIMAPGAILNGRTDEESNVTSGKTRLFAGGDIGAVDRALRTAVGFLEGRSTGGGVWIENAGALAVGGLTEEEGIVARGSITVGAGSPVTLEKNLRTTGLNENIVVISHDSPDAGDDITVKSGVELVAERGAVILRAGDNVIIEEGAIIHAASELDVGVETGDLPDGAGVSVEAAEQAGIKRVTLTGTPVAGQTWTIRVDGKEYKYDVSAGDTLYTVTRALADAIGNDASRPDGSSCTTWLEATNRIAIYREDIIFEVDYQDDSGNADPGVGGEMDIRGIILGTAARIQGDSDDDVFDITADPWHDVVGPISLHGFGGSDLYKINLRGTGSAMFNVYDKSPAGDMGADRLLIYGTPEDDFLLFRPGSISAVEVDENREPVPGGAIERVNYDGDINAGIFVFGRDGDDTFVFDGTSSPLTVYGDAGNDLFQVGQMFKSPRDGSNPDNGLGPEDWFSTTLTTRGYLSDGVNHATTLYGGTGDDTFNVYRNMAELYLYGEEDNDTFRIRAFVKVDPNDPKAPFTNINGGQGENFISYTVNAPVRIEGGSGFDTLVVVGTEFGDDFIITDQGIFGAGLFATYSGIEQIIIDGLEGNDTFFIAGTPEGTDVQIYGGLGSDTFNVSGGTGSQPVYVVGNSLQGHSGLIQHSVNPASDPAFRDLFVQDISANVADNDAPGVVIQMDQPLRVFEGGLADDDLRKTMMYAVYSVVLTRSPEEEVRVTASPSLPRESESAAGGEGILLKREGDPDAAASAQGITLLFDRTNWFIPQRVMVIAPQDDLAEGTRVYNIQHSVMQGARPDDGGAYDGIPVLGVVATVIDDDTAGVLVVQAGGDTVVAEGGAPDTYSVVLTRKPAGEVHIAISVPDGQVETDTSVLTFTPDNWNIPQVVTVTAVNDEAVEGTHFSRIQHDIISSPADFYNLNTQDVARGLKASIQGDIFANVDVSRSGDTLTITGKSGGNFTLETSGDMTVTGSQVDGRYSEVQIQINGSGLIAAGEEWILTINGEKYSYVSGKNGEEESVASVDVRILDNNTPGIVVTETGGSTNVTEPTDYVLLGSGQVTRAIDDSTFEGTFGTSVISEASLHNAIYNAQDLTDAPWGTNPSPGIDDHTIPHLTILATGNNDPDFYSFTITPEMLALGGGRVNALFDIDYGYELGDAIYWITQMTLYDADGRTVLRGMGDRWDTHYTGLDSGSSTVLDDSFGWTFTEAGTYYLSVENQVPFYFDNSRWPYVFFTGNGVPEGADYALNISLEHHRTSGFQFSPDPVLENESQSSSGTGQDVDAADGWYTFYDGNIGNKDYENGSIDFHTPYIKIIGAGDGSADAYTFVITDAMLNPTAANVRNSDVDALNTYYLAADIVLDGDYGVSAGDVWTVTLNGKPYSYRVVSGDDMAAVLAGLASEINKDVSSESAATVDGITYGGGYGADHFATADSVDFRLGGVVEAGRTWTLTLGGENYTYTTVAGDTIDTVGYAFRDHDGIPGSYGLFYNAGNGTLSVYKTDGSVLGASLSPAADGSAIVDVNENTLKVINNNGFRIDGITQEVRSAGSVTRWTEARDGSGTAVQFEDATIVLSGTPVAGEVWTVILNDGTGAISRSYTVESGKSPDQIAEELRTKIHGSGSFSAAGSGNEISISTTAASSFTVRFSIERATPAEGEAAITGAARIGGTPVQAVSSDIESISWTTAAVAFAGDVRVNEVWAVTIDGGTSYAYKAQAGDTTLTVADEIRKLIDSAFSPSATGSVLKLTNSGGFIIAWSVTATTDGTITADEGSAESIDLSGLTVAEGETWVVTFDDDNAKTTYSWKATSAETTAEAMVEKLAGEINGDAGGDYRAAWNGDTLLVVHTGGASFSSAYFLVGTAVEGAEGATNTLTLTDNVNSGNTWTVTLDDGSETTYQFVVPADLTGSQGSRRAVVAKELADAINAAGGSYQATSIGANLIIVHNDGTAFSSRYDINLGEDDEQAGLNGEDGEARNIDLSVSTVVEGETWTVTLDDGTKTTYRSTVTAAETNAGMAEALAGVINAESAPYWATWSGGTLLVVHTGGTPFSSSYTVETAPVDGTAGEAVDLSLSLAGGGTISTIETWKVTLDENDDGEELAHYSYAVQAADVGLEAVARGLADAVNNDTAGSYLALVEGTTVYVVNKSGTGFSTDTGIDLQDPEGSAMVSGTVKSGWYQDIELVVPANTDAPANDSAGDRWYVTVEGKTFSAVGLASTAAGALIAQLADEGYTAEKIIDDGTVIIRVSSSDGATVDVDEVSKERADAAASADPAVDGRDHYNNVEFVLEGNPTPGEAWSVTINGVIYSVDVPEPDPERTGSVWTLEDVARELDSKIGDNDKFSVTATGSVLTITDSTGWNETVTVSVQRGSGVVTGIFDIDNAGYRRGISVQMVVYEEPMYDPLFGIFLGNQTVYRPEYYGYVLTPSLQVFKVDEHGGPDIAITTFDVITDGSVYSSVVDQGSAASYDPDPLKATYDPFLQVDFGEAGTYKVVVRYYQDYYEDNPYFSDGFLSGVPAGLSYQLNMSLQRHEVNPEAIALVGKRVTIIEGTGAGQSRIISAYNPQTNEYTFESPWSTPPDETSRYEIGYGMQSEFPGYVPGFDTYTIVLTTEPESDVIVDVTPQVTRTYNSNLAFDASANYGENEAVQVDVATQRALLTLSGDPPAGETWIVTLTQTDGVTLSWSYQVPGGGATAAEAARALADAIDAHADFTATADGSGVVITIDNTNSFYARFGTSKGSASITGTAGTGDTWTSANITLAGTAVVGEVWTVELDGTSYRYTIFQGDQDDLAFVARGLAGRIPDETYTVSVTGSTFSIARRDGTSFSASFSIVPVRDTTSGSMTAQVVFTQDDWSDPQTVYVRAVDDDVVDGSDAIAFPAMAERVNLIRGPLTINGGVRVSEEVFLEDPFTLPGETNWYVPDGAIESAGEADGKATLTDTGATHVSVEGPGQSGFDPRMNEYLYEFTILNGPAAGKVLEVESVDGFTVTFTTSWEAMSIDPADLAGHDYFYSPVNPNVRVDEVEQVDTLNVFNGNSPADDVGVLTADRICGLGMGPDTVIGGVAISGGIQYANLEVLNIELGYGNDRFTIESTHQGVTRLYTGRGDDHVDIRLISGHTTVHTGAGDDEIVVSSEAQRVSQISGLLTVNAGSGNGDRLVVDAGGDDFDREGVLTETTLTGLGMPSAPEIQTVSVRATGGSYTLTTSAFGTDAGLTQSANVSREAHSATVTLDYGMSAADMQARLQELYGYDVFDPSDIFVERRVDGYTHTYTIMFTGVLGGLDLPQLECLDVSGLTVSPAADISVQVETATVRNGTRTPGLNTVQTLRVDAATGTFVIAFRDLLDDQGNPLTTPAIAVTDLSGDDETATDTLLRALMAVLDPNNGNPDLPHTRNVAVEKHGDVFHIIFQGAHGTVAIDRADIVVDSAFDGTIHLERRVDGINYYGVDTLDILLGSGNDRFQVRGTSPGTVTNLYTGAGDDVIDIFNADRSLDDVQGTLNIDAGTGGNMLNVDDSGDPDGDASIVLTSSSISGMAPGLITYAADGGDFTGGITLWGGSGGNHIEVTSTVKQDGILTVTTFNTGAGNDDVTLKLDASTDGFFVLNTQDGDDTVDASASSLPLVIFGGDGDDAVTGGSGDDIIFGDRGRVTYGDGSGLPVTVLGNGTPIAGIIRDDSEDHLASRAVVLEGQVSNGETYLVEIWQGGILVARASHTVTDDAAETLESIAGSLAGALQADLESRNVADYAVTSEGNRLIVGNSIGQARFGIRHDVIRKDRTDGVIRDIDNLTVVDPAVGGNDEIVAGEGSNRVFGGIGDDEITTGNGDDIVLGDNGVIEFYPGGVIKSIRTTYPGFGGDDTVTVGDGRNIILGGTGNDEITGGNGSDIVFGDNGEVLFDLEGRLETVSTSLSDREAVDVTMAVTALVSMDGTPGEGETWTVTVNGRDYNYSVAGDTTLEDLLADLAQRIDAEADYVAAVDGRTIAVTRRAGGALSVTATVPPSGTATVDMAVASITLVTMNGTPNDPGTWSLTVDGTVYRHEAAGTGTLEDVLGDLASQVNTREGFAAWVDGNGIAIARLDGSPYTVSASIPPSGSGSVDDTGPGTTLVNWNGVPNDPGTWSITVDGITYAHMVYEAGTLDEILNDLAARIDAREGYACSVDTGVMAVTRLTGGGYPDVTVSIPASGSASVGGAAIGVRLSGTPEAGDFWSITVDGTVFTHVVSATDSLGTVLNALADGIRGTEDYTTRVSGRTIEITKTGEGVLIVTAAVPASASAVVENAVATVTFDGTPGEGETWTVTVSGMDYAYDVVGETTLQDVLDDLADRIAATAGYTASVLGNSIVISRLVSGDMEVSAFVPPSGNAAVAAGTATTATVSFAGTPGDGEAWSVTVDGRDVTRIAAESDTLETVLNDLAGHISEIDGYTSQVRGTTLVIIKTAGGTLNVTVNVPESGTAIVTDREVTRARVAMTGIPNDPGIWSFSVTEPDGSDLFTCIHEVTGGSVGSLGQILEDLAAQVNDRDGFTAVVDGSAVIISRLTGDAFTVSVGIPGSGAVAVTDGSESTALVTLSGETPVPGDIWCLTVDGTQYRFIVGAGDTLPRIAEDLALQIDSVSGYTARVAGRTIVMVRLEGVEPLEASLSLIPAENQDRISLGDGDTVIFGGAGGDIITAGAGNHVVFGDHGRVRYDTDGAPKVLETTDTAEHPEYGGDDEITLGSGNGVIFGGMGDDGITTGDGTEVIFGDNGYVEYAGPVGSLKLSVIRSTEPSAGGDDVIVTGAGEKHIVGGFGSDIITAGAGNHVVFGDHGRVRYDTDGAPKVLETTDTAEHPEYGGDDEITLGSGDGVIFGGMGDDVITTGDGTEVIFGDNGYVEFAGPV